MKRNAQQLKRNQLYRLKSDHDTVVKLVQKRGDNWTAVRMDRHGPSDAHFMSPFVLRKYWELVE